jgi:hypothetical protein
MDLVNQKQIKDSLVKVDFMNGDVLHFLNHCAEGYVKTYERNGRCFLMDCKKCGKKVEVEIVEKTLKMLLINKLKCPNDQVISPPEH